MKSFIILSSIFLLAVGTILGSDNFVRCDESKPELLSFTMQGGSLVSYGCSGQDPTYFVTAKGSSIAIDFAEPQSHPSFRVWGLNDDDTVAVVVNGEQYHLNDKSAYYDKKVICKKVSKDPGEEGIKFSLGNLVGAINNDIGNYSYQNVTIAADNVKSIKLIAVSGRGWGFVGAAPEDKNAGKSSPRR